MINQVLELVYAHNPSIGRHAAKEFMPYFLKAGIWEKNSKDGLPLRKLLRDLDKDNQLHLIPYLVAERKAKNVNWFFQPIKELVKKKQKPSKAEENFTLYHEFNQPLNKEQFEGAKKTYLESLKNISSPKYNGSIANLIKQVKRKKDTEIGPYKNLSYFEVLNRIASDLVILEGARMVFNGEVKKIDIPEKITLKLGNQGGADVEIEFADGSKIFGEGFNASESLAKPKMRKSIQIIIDKINSDNSLKKEGVVFYNAEIGNKVGIGNYSNQLEIENSDITIHRIKCEIK